MSRCRNRRRFASKSPASLLAALRRASSISSSSSSEEPRSASSPITPAATCGPARVWTLRNDSPARLAICPARCSRASSSRLEAGICRSRARAYSSTARSSRYLESRSNRATFEPSPFATEMPPSPSSVRNPIRTRAPPSRASRPRNCASLWRSSASSSWSTTISGAGPPPITWPGSFSTRSRGPRESIPIQLAIIPAAPCTVMPCSGIDSYTCSRSATSAREIEPDGALAPLAPGLGSPCGWSACVTSRASTADLPDPRRPVTSATGSAPPSIQATSRSSTASRPVNICPGWRLSLTPRLCGSQCRSYWGSSLARHPSSRSRSGQAARRVSIVIM